MATLSRTLQLRNQILERLLESSLNADYLQAVSERRGKVDFGLRLATALANSAAVGSWLLAQQLDWLWLTLTGIGTVTAVILAVWNNASRMSEMREQVGQWIQRSEAWKSHLEALDRGEELDSQVVHAESLRDSQLARKIRIRKDTKLSQRLQEQLEAAHGL